jgi:ankyrin repeat protein
LIKYGVGVHHELKIKGNGERGTTSLQEALSHEPVGNRKHEVAQLLIEDGAYYDVYSACALNDTARLKTLMKEEPGVITAVEDYQMTPLHWAARAGAMECAEILLKHGASVNALNKAQRAPLQLAADRDKVDMIRLLVAHGAGLNTQDKKGRTPLHRATYGGRVAAAEALLEVGANPMMLTKTGKNAFEIARKDAKYLKERA